MNTYCFFYVLYIYLSFRQARCLYDSFNRHSNLTTTTSHHLNWGAVLPSI